jgi:methylated-DNA-protein-cysteine methyltransferase-like protein
MKETSAYSPFTARVIEVLRGIPKGKVAAYGQVAALAGSPLGARQVVRVLHTLSGTRNLPWHRVIDRQGRIALPSGGGLELQRALLESEGVKVSREGKIDLRKHLWKPTSISP